MGTASWRLCAAILGLASVSSTGCAGGDCDYPPDPCPAAVSLCEPCRLLGSGGGRLQATLDLSNIDTARLPQIQAEYGFSPPDPTDATVTIDGVRGTPRPSTLPWESGVAYFFFEGLPRHPHVLVFSSPDAFPRPKALIPESEDEVLLAFVDATCHEAFTPPPCPE